MAFLSAYPTMPTSEHNTCEVPGIWGLTEFSDSIITRAFSSTASLTFYGYEPAFPPLGPTRGPDAPLLFGSLQCQCLYNYSHIFLDPSRHPAMSPSPSVPKGGAAIGRNRKLSPSAELSPCSWLVTSFSFTT